MTAQLSFDFTGTQALVTGATSGIGHAVAVLLRDAGAAVTVTGTKPGAGDYDTDLSGMTYRQLVLTDNASVDSLAESISSLDVLVNNAGANFPPGGLDESAPPDGFAASVALNLTGPYRLTVGLRRALTASTAAGGGASVVNLASMSALRAVTMVPGYGAAKSGIVNITRNLAVKWSKYGIRVNAIAPGTIETAMTEPMHAVPEILATEIAHIPAGRWVGSTRSPRPSRSCARRRAATSTARCWSSTVARTACSRTPAVPYAGAPPSGPVHLQRSDRARSAARRDVHRTRFRRRHIRGRPG